MASGQNGLIGQRFFLKTGWDSREEFQSEHEATVIGFNIAGPDSLLLELDPPLPEGRYLLPPYKDEWRKEVEYFDKVVLLRRYAGTRVVPPGPSFPIIVHIYGWPDPPTTRKVSWNSPDDWGELFLSKDTQGHQVRGVPVPVTMQLREMLGCLIWPFFFAGLLLTNAYLSVLALLKSRKSN